VGLLKYRAAIKIIVAVVAAVAVEQKLYIIE